MDIIEEFRGGAGAVAGSGRPGGFAGAGGFGGSRGSGGSAGLSANTASQGGSRLYGSADYSKSPSFTGGSFGGLGKYGVGFPGIVPGAKLPQPSSAAVYYNPALYQPTPIKNLEQAKLKAVPSDINLPKSIREQIEKEIPVPGPRPGYGNKYDNVNLDHALDIRGPVRKASPGDENLDGIYGYRGSGYYWDPWYWGYGPDWPYTNEILNYPDIPYDYEQIMRDKLNLDNTYYSIQEDIASQLNEENKLNSELNTENKSDSIEKVMEQYEQVNGNVEHTIQTKQNIFLGFELKEFITIIILILILLYVILVKNK